MALGISWDRVPTSHLPEHELLFGYRHALFIEPDPARVEACICGGEIAVAIESPRLITEAVQRHQRTGAHRAWRARLEEVG